MKIASTSSLSHPWPVCAVRLACADYSTVTVCVAYTWGLGLVARDAGGMPTVFSDVSWLPPAIATLVYFAFIYFGNKVSDAGDLECLSGNSGFGLALVYGQA
jgi:hypothetical protein